MATTKPFPPGSLVPFVLRLVKASRWLSLEFCIERAVAKRCNVPPEGTPAWVQEVYVPATLVLGVAALFSMSAKSPAWRQSLAAGALYMVFELVCFVMRWIFTDDKPMLSLRRALAGFLLNVAGVMVYFAIALIGLDCLTPSSGNPAIAALYSSVRTFTTMGPSGIQDNCWECAALVMAEGVTSYLLSVLIIGALASFVVMERRPDSENTNQ